MDESVRVLHVDDEPDFADLTATFLKRNTEQEFTVETATSASEGLDRLAAGAFDCVISDYDMPGMDGLEFLDGVREEHPDLPFLLFTGKGSEEVASDAISAGVTDYLQKGGGTEQYELLATRVENAVEKARMQADRQRQLHAIETAREGIAMLDDDLRFTTVNGAYATLFGYDPEEMVGESWELVYAEEATEDVTDEIAPSLREDGYFRGETTFRRADGSRFVGDHVVSKTEGEEYVCLASDITDRKERQRELEKIRERMEFTLDGTDSVIYDVDLEEYEETRHGAFERLYGLDPEEFSQTSEFYDAAIHPADREKMRVFERTEELRDRDTVEWEYRTHPDRGEVRWLYSIADIRSGPDGEPTRAFGLVTDVTERKRRERELERQNERLEKFASVVSHDLRNPLNVAQLRLKLAREDHESDDLASAVDALERSQALIDDLLALAREGEAVSDLEPVDLAAVVDDCWHNVETTDASLVVDTDRTIRADPDRLKQLLENLIRNAVDHADGYVTVTVGDLEDGFYVADDGPGIPEPDREQIFESGYSTDEGGSGFGLAIVAEIAEAHGWSVAVTDGEDGGACFEITGVEIDSNC